MISDQMLLDGSLEVIGPESLHRRVESGCAAGAAVPVAISIGTAGISVSGGSGKVLTSAEAAVGRSLEPQAGELLHILVPALTYEKSLVIRAVVFRERETRAAAEYTSIQYRLRDPRTVTPTGGEYASRGARAGARPRPESLVHRRPPTPSSAPPPPRKANNSPARPSRAGTP